MRVAIQLCEIFRFSSRNSARYLPAQVQQMTEQRHWSQKNIVPGLLLANPVHCREVIVIVVPWHFRRKMPSRSTTSVTWRAASSTRSRPRTTRRRWWSASWRRSAAASLPPSWRACSRTWHSAIGKAAGQLSLTAGILLRQLEIWQNQGWYGRTNLYLCIPNLR